MKEDSKSCAVDYVEDYFQLTYLPQERSIYASGTSYD